MIRATLLASAASMALIVGAPDYVTPAHAINVKVKPKVKVQPPKPRVRVVKPKIRVKPPVKKMLTTTPPVTAPEQPKSPHTLQDSKISDQATAGQGAGGGQQAGHANATPDAPQADAKDFGNPALDAAAARLEEIGEAGNIPEAAFDARALLEAGHPGRDYGPAGNILGLGDKEADETKPGGPGNNLGKIPGQDGKLNDPLDAIDRGATGDARDASLGAFGIRPGHRVDKGGLVGDSGRSFDTGWYVVGDGWWSRTVSTPGRNGTRTERVGHLYADGKLHYWVRRRNTAGRWSRVVDTWYAPGEAEPDTLFNSSANSGGGGKPDGPGEKPQDTADAGKPGSDVDKPKDEDIAKPDDVTKLYDPGHAGGGGDYCAAGIPGACWTPPSAGNAARPRVLTPNSDQDPHQGATDVSGSNFAAEMKDDVISKYDPDSAPAGGGGGSAPHSDPRGPGGITPGPGQ